MKTFLAHCHCCAKTLTSDGGALKAGQVYFCSAECFHLGDGDAIEHGEPSRTEQGLAAFSEALQRPLPDSNSPYGLARQQIGELLIENKELNQLLTECKALARTHETANAELKRQVDNLIKNGLSPEAKEIIELVAENLPSTIERAFKDRALRTAVEHYRQIGALQHSFKCTYKMCVCGLEDIFNALE